MQKILLQKPKGQFPEKNLNSTLPFKREGKIGIFTIRYYNFSDFYNALNLSETKGVFLFLFE